MSAIDNCEISPSQVPNDNVEIQLSEILKTGGAESPSAEKYTVRKPKRILYFSDGTLEEFDDDESEEEIDGENDVERPFQKATVKKELSSEPPVDTKTLSWPDWLKYYSVQSGSKTLNFLDKTGENLAYMLGISTPKYQYEIDEYLRTKKEETEAKKKRDAEIEAWASKCDPNPEPITSEKSVTVNRLTNETEPI